MLIRVKRKLRHPDAPQRHDNHRRPMTRRELIGQGFLTGGATVLSTGLFSLFANPRAAFAQLARPTCRRTRTCSAAASIEAARRFRSSASTSRAARTSRARTCSSASRTVSSTRSRRPATASSACRATRSRASRKPLRARRPRATAITPTRASGSRSTATARSCAACTRASRCAGIAASINGAVIPARSENDTSNNPHNPLYGIQRAGAEGSILTLIGSQNTDSGGNSMAPGDDDQCRVPADEGRPAERRDGPRRHERSAEAAAPTRTRSP